MSPARDGILPVGRAPLRASEEWSWHPGRVPDVAQRDDWTDLAPIPTRAVAATADADRHASDALGIFLRPSRTPGRRAEIDRFPRSALNRAAVVEVTGRYLNPSDQGERLHDLLQIVPSRLNGQYSNQEGRPSTAETGAGRGVGHRLQNGVNRLPVGRAVPDQPADSVQAPGERRRTSPRTSPIPRTDRASNPAVRHGVVIGQRWQAAWVRR